VQHVQMCTVACAFHSLHDSSSDIVHFISSLMQGGNQCGRGPLNLFSSGLVSG